MYEEFEKTLNKEQKHFFYEIGLAVNLLNGNIFEDGIRYGLMLATEMRELLNNPEEAFTELENSLTPFEELNSSEIEALEEFKKSKITEAKINQNMVDFIKAYSKKKGGASYE